MFPKNNPSYGQSGGVLIYVFIGIALFAALAFTFSKSFTGNSQSTMTEGQAKIQATKVIATGESIKKAVDRLLSKGCSESQLIFYIPGTPIPVGGAGSILGGGSPFYINHKYGNAARGSPDCKVFATPGGGAKAPINTTDIFSSSASGDYSWGISIENRILGVGTDTNPSPSYPATEMVFVANNIKPEICAAINRSLGLPAPLVVAGNIDGGQYNTGTFGYSDDFGNGASVSLKGKTQFCINMGGIPSYLSVLIAR